MSLATTTLATTVAATVSQSTVAAPAGDVAVTATRTANAYSYNFVLSIAIAIGGAGAGAVTTSTVSGSTSATVQQASTMTAGGAVTVQATTAARSTAETEGGAGGVLAITALFATADLSATTSATIDASTVSAPSVSVDATRNSIDPPSDSTYAHVVIGQVSFLAGGAGGKAVATDSGAVLAGITGGSTVTSTGAVAVAATNSTSTNAVNNGGSGSFVFTVQVQLTSASNSADTTALVSADSGVRAGSLSVTADAVTPVTTSVFTLGIALAAGAGADVLATSSGAVTAYVGTALGGTAPASPKAIDVTGTVTITAGVEQSATAGGAAFRRCDRHLRPDRDGPGDRDQPGLRRRQHRAQRRRAHRPGPQHHQWRAQRTVTATIRGRRVGVAAGAGTSSTAVINGSLEAFIGAMPPSP